MTCTVCGADNPATATVCHTCKAFLQNRVPTLDLFSTAWRAMTAPAGAFHEIAIAEHKNYAFTLFGLAGIPTLSATVAWLEAGDLVGGLFETTGIVIAAGTILGVLLGLVLTALHTGASALVRGDVAFRRSLGITAYALVPALGVGLALVPIELLTFGEHWYVGNPSPSTINGASYWAIVLLQALGAAWSTVLLVIGGRVGLRVAPWRSAIAALLSLGALTAGWMWLAQTAFRIVAAAPVSSIPGT